MSPQARDIEPNPYRAPLTDAAPPVLRAERPKKPLSIWLVQALWLIGVVVELIPMVQVPARLSAWSWHVPWLLLLLALAVGLELRHAWARWTSGALIALGTLGAAYQSFAGMKHAPSSLPPEELLGQALAATLLLWLSYRSTLAAPAVRYFTWALSEPEELASALDGGRRRRKSRRRRKRAVVR